MTTFDNDYVANITSAWDNIMADPSGLVDLVNDAKAEAIGEGSEKENDERVCSITAKRISTLTYPPIERMPAFQPRGLGLSGPNVFVGSKDSIVPSTELVKGNEYTLFLQNFPAKNGYEVRLINGLDSTGPVIASSDKFKGDDKFNTEEIKWTVPTSVPDSDTAGSRYYLKVNSKQVPGLFAFSLPFHLSGQSSNRRI